MQTLQEVLNAARSLSVTERMKLVESLWEEVPPTDWPLPNDDWIAEAQRRSDEYDTGKTTAASWSEVRERARRKANLDA